MSGHLWMVNHYATQPGEGTLRHFSLARGLLSHGWTTSILAASTLHPQGIQRSTFRGLASTNVIGDIVFRWFSVPSYGRSRLLRVLNMLAFFFAVLRPGATKGLERPDAIIGSSVHPLAAWAGCVLARRNRVPFYFEIRDLWPQTIIDMGAISPGGFIARAMRWLEKHLCDAATSVIVTMPHANEYLETRGVNKSKVHWISNGVDVTRFNPAPHSESSAFEFLYFGSLGDANRVDHIIESFASVDNRGKHTTLKIVGSGPNLVGLKQLASDLGVQSSVIFQGRVGSDEIPHYASQAHCLVAATLPLSIYNYGISLNKLFEYMAAGRPIIFAGNVRGNPVELAAGGICTDGTLEGTRDAMSDVLRAEHDVLAGCGRNNRRLVERMFDFPVLARKLATVLESRGRETGDGAPA